MVFVEITSCMVEFLRNHLNGGASNTSVAGKFTLIDQCSRRTEMLVVKEAYREHQQTDPWSRMLSAGCCRRRERHRAAAAVAAAHVDDTDRFARHQRRR